RIVRLVLDRHLVRSHEQLPVWSRAEVNALACRLRRQGRIHQSSNQAFFVGINQLVVLPAQRANAIFIVGQGQGRDVIGIQSGSIDQAAGADLLTVGGDDVGVCLCVNTDHAVIEDKLGTGSFRVGPQ